MTSGEIVLYSYALTCTVKVPKPKPKLDKKSWDAHFIDVNRPIYEPFQWIK